MTVHDLAAAVTERRRALGLTDKEVVGDLLQPMDRDVDWMAGDNNYTWWAAIGMEWRPWSVVEIGTRFGYSLKALLGCRAGPAVRVASVDAECNPGELSRDVFLAYFRDVLEVPDLNALKVDSQTLAGLPWYGFDLGVVDGLHSTSGCLHDCGLVWEALWPNGLMVVDDTIEGGEPRAAVEQFCASRGLELAHLPSLRGVTLVIKPDAP